ncbi:hypothetical protein SUGI_0738090 [Cryptomeria japonica]|nr:hypothetical protein SUGI_0738090 [Cryptomeria japonica]
MAVLLSRFLQFPISLSEKNGNAPESVTSMECMAAETELDFVGNNNVNVKSKLLSSREAMHSIRISEVEEAKNNVGDEEDDEKTMEKFMCKFASCLVDNVLKQSSGRKSRGCKENDFMYDESFRLDKGLKFKISVEVHHLYRPSNVGLGEDTEVSSLVKDGVSESRSYEGHDNVVEAEEVREDWIMLELPPRLKQASDRNPLHLNCDSTRFHSSCCRPPLLYAKSLTKRIAAKPVMHNAVKIQKDFMSKLWASSRHMMVVGKHTLKRPLCLCQRGPDFRKREWLLSLAIKFRSRCKKLICASTTLCSPPT